MYTWAGTLPVKYLLNIFTTDC